MKNSSYAQAARAAPLVCVLSEAVLVLDYEYEYDYDYGSVTGLTYHVLLPHSKKRFKTF